MNSYLEKIKHFWEPIERRVFAINLAVYLGLTLLALIFMPYPFYSEHSLHDGHLYFTISQNLLPDQPIANLSWHKRILQPLLANLVFPSERHLSFWLLGVIPASLSAVYFYKIARRYTENALPLTWVYSFLPWLLFSALHSLSEPLLMLFLLAGFYYYLQNQFWLALPAYALAALTKEVALLAIAALTLVILWKDGWKRAAIFSLAIVPFGSFCLVYGYHWGDCLWCARVEPNNGLSWIPGVWWIFRTFIEYPASSANPTIAFLYNSFNQFLNLALLALVAVGIFRLRALDKSLLIYCGALSLPLYFLGPDVYSLNVNLGRQFLISSLALIGYADLFSPQNRFGRWIARPVGMFLVLLSPLLLAFLWIMMYSKYFLYHKFF